MAKTSLVARSCSLLAGMMLTMPPAAFTQQRRGIGEARDCVALTLSQPSEGTASVGTVRIDPFGISLTVPDGLVGWGAAQDAPFHGFAIFLGTTPRACIVFGIYWEFQISGSDLQPPRGRAVKVGNRVGWERRTRGAIEGLDWTNVTVTFPPMSVPTPQAGGRRSQDVEVGWVALATPTKDLATTLPVLQKFVGSFRFAGKPTGHHGRPQ